MKVIVYGKDTGITPPQDISGFLGVLGSKGIDCLFNEPFADRIHDALGVHLPAFHSIEELNGRIDAVISYGGDGTFLQSVAMLKNRPIPIIGINTGRLGFLATTTKEEVARTIDHLMSNDYTIEERTMLAVDGDFDEGMDYRFAFNEFSIQKEGLNMIEVDVSIDGEPVAAYVADGVMISTPSGSTAYAMSVGGPIISPACDCFLVCPIAPHNLNMRPLVVESSGVFELKVETRNPSCIATLDNRVSRTHNKAVFTVKKSEHKVKLIKLPDTSFYKTLRKKLFWGIDARDKIK